MNALRRWIGGGVGRQEVSLYEPNQLPGRIEALDQLDVFDIEAPPPTVTDSTVGAAVYRRAREIQAKLEAANSKVYEKIRGDVRSGRGALSLRQWLPTSGSDLDKGEGCDYLDELLAGVFQFEEPGAVMVQPAAEMVSYQPTPARHIFDLLHRTALARHDVLIDLGSGFGHVPLLTCICTGARSVGVELEPAYVKSARRSAELLNLKRVTFLTRDARTVDLTEGTVFYLYTPFTGQMLRSMLDSLRREGVNRDIRVCTLGPCTMTVAKENWLEAIGPTQLDRISVFRSHNASKRLFS